MSRATAMRRGANFLVTTLLCASTAACQRRHPAPVSPSVEPSSTDAAAGPRLPRIPRDAARFEIDAVDDSTATFRVQEVRWIRVGLPAYAVDPAHRDALVARLTITRQDGSTATALVTSQVARVNADHFLLVPQPRVAFWRTRQFWLSAVAGGAVGAGITAVVR